MIQVVEQGREFLVQFDYNPRLVEAVKTSFTKRRWDGLRKCWVVPTHLRSEMAQFKLQYNIQEPTREQAAEIVGEIPELPELTIDTTSILNIQPFPYQAKGIARGLQLKRFINGDQPGLGKTLQSLATVTLAGAFPCLVICPTSLKENWRREWEKFAGKKAGVMVDSVAKTWPTFLATGSLHVWIVNYESLKKYFVLKINKRKGKDGKDAPLKLEDIIFRPEVAMFKAVIIDECHRLKDAGTQQSKFTKGVATGKDWIIGLTGTPIVNKPKDLISQLGIIGHLSSFGGMKNFLDRYCDGGMGAGNLRELHYRLNTTCFFRREKTDVLKELPAKMRQVVLCDITTRPEYKKAEDDFINYLTSVKGCTDAEVRKKLRGEVMVKMGILKSISSRGKINDAAEYITEVVDSGEKIVVFCWLKDIMKELIGMFPGSVHISGDVSTEQRQIAVDRFQKDPKTQVIFLNIKAGGVGLTLTAASRVAFVEFPWTYADCEQCEDRCHRIGQLDSVQCTYFLGENTIDRYCYDLIQSKKSIANTVTGTADNVQEDVVDNLLNLFNQKP